MIEENKIVRVRLPEHWRKRIEASVGNDEEDLAEAVEQLIGRTLALEETMGVWFNGRQAFWLLALFSNRLRQILQLTGLTLNEPNARGLAAEAFRHVMLNSAGSIVHDEIDERVMSRDTSNQADYHAADTAPDICADIQRMEGMSDAVIHLARRLEDHFLEHNDVSASHVAQQLYPLIAMACEHKERTNRESRSVADEFDFWDQLLP
ncbi:hypothetical protein ACFQ14_01115 [Pseudahrensia aquimaris]|uniref:Uncharacterized protein n=1 Tax=Pseudahrensia aquimaris TaxID=744461 RepID=A0ABW3F972_9HYPH